MSRELEKRIKEAERLLKQGRTQLAVREFRRLVEESPRDLILLNRVGDLLARSGERHEAIGCYERIAQEFTRSGFLPKAVAILKKILRLEPERTSALLMLGDAYAKQSLPGEARSHFLQAADRFLRSKETSKAREVYERLVSLEPKEPLHRVRLAETRATEGNTTGAANDLVAVAADMLASGRATEAESTYRRAASLAPGRPEPILGISRCLVAQDRAEEAKKLLEGTLEHGEPAGVVTAELLGLYERMGRSEDALELVGGTAADELSDDLLEAMVRPHVEQGHPEQAWQRVDAILARWSDHGRFDRLVPLLERLSQLEPQGHIPALERLLNVQRAQGSLEGTARVLERLIRAARARSLDAQAASLLEELRKVAPDSPLLGEPRSKARAWAPPTAAPAREEAPPEIIPAPSGGPPRGGDRLEALVEAPATPQSQADREFVTGHLTEAEVFQKYSLFDEAIQQFREVTRRFPGHVAAQERLASILRARKDREALRDVLVELALARRASGDEAGAIEAARMAAEQGPLPPQAQAVLMRMELLEPAKPVAPPETLDRVVPASPAERPGKRSEIPPSPAQVPAEANTGTEDEVEIVFEGAEEATPIGEPTAEAPAKPAAVGTGRLDEEDLSTISAALEAELAKDSAGSPPAAAEQSLEEVFEAFKRHVDTEVDRGDFRTHYDLGIAYKEMGMIEDAIAEFEIATRSQELFLEASSMRALCHKERGEMAEAARCYREVLEAESHVGADLRGLRYELAEVLLESGDAEGALAEFGVVEQADPSYRDVASRVSELKARLRSSP